MKEITIKVPDNCELKQDGNTYTIVEKEKKPAWSEEDERLIKFLIAHFSVSHPYRSFKFDINTDITTDEIIERIRNLSPQSQWKPSDEQIGALLKLEEMHVLEHEKNQENAHLYMVIKSLREQLLKLKEE